MRVRVVVQARMSSERLPGKSMLDVGGLPLAELVLRRLARGGLEVILATSRENADDVLAETAEQSGFRCVRGPLDDVLGRFELATRDLDNHDLVVRATADNPVPDTALAGIVLASAVGGGAAWVGIDQESVPYGLSLEAVRVGALRAACSTATSSRDREHVTTWIRRHLATHTAAPSNVGPSRSYRCTVDDLDDYVNASRAFAFVGDPVAAPWREVLEHFTPQAPVMVDPRPESPGLAQSRFVMGGAQLGAHYGRANEHGAPVDSELCAMLDLAKRVGITHVDTARAYKNSESRLGWAAARGDWVPRVVTKVAPIDGGSPEAHVPRSIAASLAALGERVSVDAVLMHRARDAVAGWSALQAAQEEFALPLIGASVQSPEELLDVLRLPGMGYVQVPVNVLDRRWTSPRVRDSVGAIEGLTVTARSVYLQGLLVRPDLRWPNCDAEWQRRETQAIDTAAALVGRDSRAALSLGYVLSIPWVTSVVVGAETVRQLGQSAITVAAGPLTPDESALVEQMVPAAPLALADPTRWPR